MQSTYRLIALAVIIMLLNACHRYTAVKPFNASNLIDLSAVTVYQFSGKMSFSDGQDGGSGSIQWQHNDGLINVRLKGPLGSNSWRLSEQEMGAELWADGRSIFADSAQLLISDQLGWQVPWQQLKSWVIGQPHDLNQGQIDWQTEGFTLIQSGWQIEYSRLKSYPNTYDKQIHHKMVARKQNYAIKLSIKQWTW